MKEPAGGVIHLAVERKGTMAAFVSENPDASADETLEKAVDHPGGAPSDGIRNSGNVGKSSVGESSNHGKIAKDVVVRGDERGLETVCGNGVLDGLDIGELRLKSDL